MQVWQGEQGQLFAVWFTFADKHQILLFRQLPEQEGKILAY